MKYEIIDFRGSVGCLVKHSSHWIKEVGCKQNRNLIGIITDLSYFTDLSGKVQCWPSILWEESSISGLCNPLHVVFYRKSQMNGCRKVEAHY